jgi:hypothetical protein
MIIQDTSGLGQVEVTTIPLPDYAKNVSATYLYSGKVMVFYHKESDPIGKDFYHIAVMNDDGSDFRSIFSGFIPQHKKANGIRHMPYADNKRVLLGDYVLEASPDFDTCTQAQLVPVKFPWLLPLDPRVYKHWSEPIIAPDNEHVAWTMLRMDTGAANCMGVLVRKSDHYAIEQTQVISSMEGFKKDEAHIGFVLPQVMRGGEIKQFVKGGTAISMVGAKDGYLADSVVQDLVSGEMTQITRTPGYDETTVFSPDECLGMVMTTRGSPKTNLAILGLLPRPYGRLATMGMTMYVYMYSVAGVRAFRPGNIGPALVDIERSMNEPGYQGMLLNDPEEKWVYVSPMSWHPSSQRAMWLEMLRGGKEGSREMRIRKVTLLDYQPGPAVAFQRTPEEIAYGKKGLAGALSLWIPQGSIHEGKIAGKHSGYVEFHTRGGAYGGSTTVKYVHVSDDGKTFTDGFEKVAQSFSSGAHYEADVVMTGDQPGEMKLRLAFSRITFTLPPKLLFEPAEDGKPKSYGYARFTGTMLRVEDLVE